MVAIIGTVISFIGAYFYDLDFCTLYTFISIALELQKNILKQTNDKTAKR